MVLSGRLIKGTKTIREETVEVADDRLPFRDMLEECFLRLCKELEIQVPLWLRKNTMEFAHYRRTFLLGNILLRKYTLTGLK